MIRRKFLYSIGNLLAAATATKFADNALSSPHNNKLKQNNIIITGTRSGVGKNIVTASLIKNLVKKNLRCYPFKPISIDYSSKNSELLRPTESVLIQAIAANVEVSAFMNPLRMVFGDQLQFPKLYINGRFINVKPEELSEGEKVRVIKSSLEFLSENYPGIVVAEASGGISDWFDNSFCNSIIELLNPVLILVADSSQGGELASIKGTLELMPKSIKGHLAGIVVNNIARKADSNFVEKCEKIAQSSGTQILGYLPTMVGIDALNENIDLQDETEINNQLEYASVVFKNHITMSTILNKINY